MEHSQEALSVVSPAHCYTGDFFLTLNHEIFSEVSKTFIINSRSINKVNAKIKVTQSIQKFEENQSFVNFRKYRSLQGKTNNKKHFKNTF